MPDTDQPSLTITLCNSLREVDASEWDALTIDANPFTSHAYLEALEATGCVGEDAGWQPVHLLGRDEAGALRGAMPLYVKTHSYGEYVFDQSWAQAYESAGGRYYPKLQASVPFTPVTGSRLLAADIATKQALVRAAINLCDHNRLSSLHVTFPTHDEWQMMGERGLLLRQDQQFWWENRDYGTFDDFLAALSSNRRKVIRRERRDLSHLDMRVITGTDITEAHLDHLYEFIEDTSDRKWGRPYLNRDFFSLITERMRDKIVLIFAYDGDQPIAGAINYLGGDTLYGRQWGCNRQVPFLHFEVCYYQAIDYAIAHGLKRVEAGAQGEHKLARGYLPQAVYSAHYIRDKALRTPIEHYLNRERDAVAAYIESSSKEGSPFKNLS
ncbi:GNAT family N-acetyltransferase [Asticcacaulis sp. SL142]|uniref:GNAT family N-acetyltransferase n=1 Tax=Asticcacaulis sp. SL142 TaxID=2995155 RepID=UPI00226CBEAD|nr:GNAT family N-acetyltransferase [Asticcacaulis sp. SL142]WAC48328.1 GNAT family N-acetyltransferase [Asticcacaulis sp. SL142]